MIRLLRLYARPEVTLPIELDFPLIFFVPGVWLNTNTRFILLPSTAMQLPGRTQLLGTCGLAEI